jgi:hypothetical protein
MKTIATSLLVTTVIIIAACGASKKSTTAAAPVTPPASTTPAATPPMVFANPETGIRVPGNAELAAIQTQYQDATLAQLREGHLLYTESSCVKCHEAQSIYKFNETQWKDIINNMAIKARMSAAEKDAVYKYVLAIKATQPK